MRRPTEDELKEKYPWRYECSCSHVHQYQNYMGEQRACTRCKGIMKLVRGPDGWHDDEEWAKRIVVPMLHTTQQHFERGDLPGGGRLLMRMLEKVVERLVDNANAGTGGSSSGGSRDSFPVDS